MEIPCKECLVFACCRNRVLIGNDFISLWRLFECEIFSEWYNSEGCVLNDIVSEGRVLNDIVANKCLKVFSPKEKE